MRLKAPLRTRWLSGLRESVKAPYAPRFQPTPARKPGRSLKAFKLRARNSARERSKGLSKPILRIKGVSWV